MRSSLFRLLLTTGLASASLLGVVSTSSAEPDRKDRRDDRKDDRKEDRRDDRKDRDRDRDRDRGGPREAPPAPKAERPPGARGGFVWVAGEWDWRANRWDWTPGHWERERAGKKWRETRWEKQGDVFIRITGDWIDGGVVVVAPSQHPTNPPPSPREERVAARAGFVWDPGHYEWKNGAYNWIGGHWERERPKFKFVPGHWENRGGHWEWIDNQWNAEGAVVVSAYPKVGPPPPPRDAIVNPGPGQVWIPGRYEFRNGNYQWKSGFLDKPRAGHRFNAGRWEEHNGRWEFHEGGWVAASEFPPLDMPPPALRPERQPPPGPGDFWVSGYWSWKDGQYDWNPGKHIKVPANHHFIQHKWVQRDGHWYLDADGMKANFPVKPPPAEPREPPQTRPGHAWAPGFHKWNPDAERYDWVPGHLEPGHVGERFTPGRWTTQVDPYSKRPMYVFAAGTWARDPGYRDPTPPPPPPPSYPPAGGGRSSPPPAPRPEKYEPKAGFIWAKGHYEWKTNAYEWVDGHWERERAKGHWVDAHWDLRGKEWEFTPGGWEK
jgi:hypothetical protein